MFERWVEDGLLDVLEDNGVGCIPFSPLAQGLLTNKYLNGIPKDSRIATGSISINQDILTKETLAQISKLNEIAQARNQDLAQMALSWILKDERITSVLIGASKPEQILNSVKAIDHVNFSEEELLAIEGVLK